MGVWFEVAAVDMYVLQTVLHLPCHCHGARACAGWMAGTVELADDLLQGS